MRRLLLAAALAVASAGVAAPASAEPFEACAGSFDYLCWTSSCDPERGCTIDLCLVWLNGRCGVA